MTEDEPGGAGGADGASAPTAGPPDSARPRSAEAEHEHEHEPAVALAGELGSSLVGDDEGAVPPAPTTATEDDLRAAVGVAPTAPATATATATAPAERTPRRPPTRPPLRDDDSDSDDDDGGGPKKKRGKLGLVLAIGLLIGLLITSIVFIGSSNAGRYFERCHADTITAERGRSFPPWGSSRLSGPAWKPIAIPPGAECVSRETADPEELAGWFLEALVERAQAKLTAKEVTAVDQAQLELEQALLLARDPDRRDQRKEIDRLLGDVEYWRGKARVRAAIDTLEEAGRRYDAAADKRPRHASDAAAWAAWVRRVARDLAAGPGGVIAPLDAPDGERPRPDVPVGVALPVEEPALQAPDAGVPTVDAGLPQGGVLL